MSSTSAQPDIVIVGGGSAGIATAASLLKRRRDLDILIIEPQTKHYYQPGWTLVGAGVFRAASTERDEEGVIPRRARWLKAAVAAFAPRTNEVIGQARKAGGWKRSPELGLSRARPLPRQ